MKLTVLFMLLFALQLPATITANAEIQQNEITGRVTDSETGQTLPGVSVAVKGTTIGTSTDVNGEYRLTVPTDARALVFSFIGMTSIEITIGDRRIIDVVMQPDIMRLEEVVVVGFGTVRKRDLTGSVSSVRMEDVESRPTGNFGDALQGQISGVQVVQGTGRPGSDPLIQVRGLNSISAGRLPLLVIDGVPQENMRDMSVIDPTTIESIEVLKDASAAAIYGSRGGSGVILVTTKRARAGTRTFNANYTSSLQQLPRRIPMMNADQFMQAAILAAQNAWVYHRKGDPNAPNTVAARGNVRYTWPQEWENPSFRASWPNTDWQDVTYSNAMMNRINVSGSGGTEGLNYFFSGSFHDQDGLVDNGHNLKRIHLDGKIESQVTDWLRTGISMNNRISNEINDPLEWRTAQDGIQYPPVFPQSTQEGYAGGATNIMNDSRYPSTTPAMTTFDGHFFNNISNPYTSYNDVINNESNRVLGNVWGELAILDGLTFKSSYTYNQSWRQASNYESVDNNMPETFWRVGNLSRNMNRTNGWYLENMVTYLKNFGPHRINFTAGHVAEKRNRMGFSASRRSYENDLTPFLNIGKEVVSAGDSESTTTFESLLARINYSFMDRYLLTATIRRDGSSRFGSENKWGYFPSIATGWIISEENFMSNLDIIDFLKLRVSYGLTGNDNFSDYIWIPTLGQGTTPIGGQLTSFYQKGQLPNPELKWERTGQLNAGFDLTVLNSRISLTADYYNSITDDLLLNLPISSLTGFTSLMQNVGKVQNQGLELGLTTRNITGEFNWTTNTNFSFNRDKVLDLGPEEFLQSGGSWGMQIRSHVNQPIFQYYGYDYIGTYRDEADITNTASWGGATPGDAKYRDVNGDGKIDSDDRTLIGTPFPDYIWSMTNRFNYKGFDFSTLINASQGGQKVNVLMRRTIWWHGGRNMLDHMLDAWTPENPDSYYFKISSDVPAFNRQPSTYWMEDASFIKLKDITLGYTVPSSLTSRAGLSSLRIYLNVNNVFSWDKFTGHDPEQGYNTDARDHIMRGYSHTEYAIPRVYTAGINITF